jgi:hypothetical protein
MPVNGRESSPRPFAASGDGFDSRVEYRGRESVFDSGGLRFLRETHGKVAIGYVLRVVSREARGPLAFGTSNPAHRRRAGPSQQRSGASETGAARPVGQITLWKRRDLPPCYRESATAPCRDTCNGVGSASTQDVASEAEPFPGRGGGVALGSFGETRHEARTRPRARRDSSRFRPGMFADVAGPGNGSEIMETRESATRHAG